MTCLREGPSKSIACLVCGSPGDLQTGTGEAVSAHATDMLHVHYKDSLTQTCTNSSDAVFRAADTTLPGRTSCRQPLLQVKEELSLSRSHIAIGSTEPLLYLSLCISEGWIALRAGSCCSR